MSKEIKFTKTFLWGAATSAYQCEGGAKGKGLSVFDDPKLENQSINYPDATGFYENWSTDIDLMAELGLKCYRFSIAWTRIFKNGIGEVNEEGIEFYDKVIDKLIEKKIEPIITMFHYDTPLELQNAGGWYNREAIVPAFVNYAKTLFENFGDKVNYWLTFNEQNMMTLVGHVTGVRKASERHDYKRIYQENHNMFIAQALTIKLFKKMCPNKKIGLAPNVSLIYPNSSAPEDQLAAGNANAIRNWLYLDVPCKGEYNPIVLKYLENNGWEPNFLKEDSEILKNSQPDFIGFNYYSTKTVSAPNKSLEECLNANDDQETWTGMFNFFDAKNNPHLQKTNFGWGIDPIGLRNTAREIYGRYNLPMIITENGLGSKNDLMNSNMLINDDYRIEFIKTHLIEIEKAISEGIPIFGYCLWSFIDLISTHNGLSKRYGLIYVDVAGEYGEKMKRYKKESFTWYKNVILQNKL